MSERFYAELFMLQCYTTLFTSHTLLYGNTIPLARLVLCIQTGSFYAPHTPLNLHHCEFYSFVQREVIEVVDNTIQMTNENIIVILIFLHKI